MIWLSSGRKTFRTVSSLDHEFGYLFLAVEPKLIDVTAEAKQIRVPTLILHVRGDQLIPLVLAKQTAELIPGSRLVIIEGDDYAQVPSDGEAEQIARVVQPFLDGP